MSATSTTNAFRDASIARPGARVAYQVGGAGEPTIVLGHSLLCDASMWADVAPRLAARRRVINVEVRGHGRSTAEAPFALEDLADDWRAILDELDVADAVLVGLSMGAMTAMRLALASPERVRGMVLLDSSADRETRFGRVKYRAMAEIARRFGIVRALERPIRNVMFARASLRERRDVVDRGMATIRAHDTKQLYHAVRAVIDRPSIRGRLSALRCPVHVVCGADDRATPPVRSRRIAEMIPGATLALVPGAGHLSALERPDEVVREIETFLSKIELRAAAGERTI
jgi:3-oxoadipate enol-lactonase